MTFQFSTNNHPINITDAIFGLKQFLVSLGWSVTSSSDGTTYDNGGDTILNSGSGANGLGNHYAWFVLKQAGDTRSICFQRFVFDYLWRIKYSVPGFGGGSPSATQVPTAVNNDEAIIFGTGTDAAPDFRPLGQNCAVMQLCADNTTPAFYWITYTTTNNVTYIGNTFVFDPVLFGSPADQDGYVLYLDSSLNSCKYLNISNPSSSSSPQCYYRRGLGKQTFSRVPGCFYTDADSTILIPNKLPVNSIDGNDDVFPVFYAGSSYFYSKYVTLHYGYKGVSSLMKWCSKSRNNLDLISLSSPGDRIVFGNINVPWDSSVPALV